MFPQFDPDAERSLLTKGMAASPGAAVGQVVFDSATAVARAAEGRSVLLVRRETTPDDLEGMIAASELGAGMLAFQRYDVNRWIESENTVVCQAEWHAELAKDAGSLRRGQRLHTYSVLIFTFRDDKIIRQEAYDCYEPFDY